jgi:hypothetical protein
MNVCPNACIIHVGMDRRDDVREGLMIISFYSVFKVCYSLVVKLG